MLIGKDRIEKLKKMLDRLEFMFLITSCLSAQEISSLSKKIGISYNGYRTGSIPLEVLAIDLTEEFFSDLDSAKVMVDLLDEKCNFEKGVCEGNVNKELVGLSDQEIGWLLWGLLGKPEEQCEDLIDSILDNLQDRVMEKRWRIVEERKGYYYSTVEESEKLKRKLKEMGRREEKFKHQKERLERKIEELLQSLSQKESSLEELSSRCHSLEKESRQLKSELASIKTRVGDAERLKEKSEKEIQEVEVLKSKIGSLEKELALREEKLKNLENLKRVGVFVDAQNLYYAAKEEFKGKLDYKALLDKIVKGSGKEERFLAGAYAYLVENPDKDQTKFKNLLESLGFQVKFRELLERTDGSKKGNWDLGLTIDILQTISRFDVVIIVSGDGDFVDLIKYLKRHHDEVKVEVAAFPSRQRTSQRLIREADYFHELGRDVIIKEE
jgi:uncharacterized LabA/DUF88 family protein